jgi:hypothetical protein
MDMCGQHRCHTIVSGCILVLWTPPDNLCPGAPRLDRTPGEELEHCAAAVIIWYCHHSIWVMERPLRLLILRLGVKFSLVVLQMFFQFKFFLPDPVKNDVKYQASAQPFLVFGLLTTALAIGHYNSLA